jgi:hypothetical protein
MVQGAVAPINASAWQGGRAYIRHCRCNLELAKVELKLEVQLSGGAHERYSLVVVQVRDTVKWGCMVEVQVWCS